MRSLYTTFIFILGMLGILSGCVGTVQNAGLPATSIASEPRAKIHFNGVYSVVAISQSKFEIFFYPATGGSGRYNYIIYVGDRPTPVTLPSEVMLQDYRGLLKATVTGLETGKSYFVKVEAQDQVSEGKDNNDAVLEATTFLNLVADFAGIASVSNSAGIDGLDSIKVRWPHAYVDVGSVGGATTDPKSYEIVAVDSNLLTPANMDDADKGPTQGRFVKNVVYNAQINETVLRGLKADTKYHVRVRALHKDSINDVNNPRFKSELNTNYLSIKTLSADLGSVNFKADGLAVTRNSGSAQSTSVVLSWPASSGVFDHLRVYYSQDEASLNSLDTSECPLTQVFGCKKYPASSTGAIIANLEPNKDYFFRLLVCQFDDCANFILGNTKSGSTKPLIAAFPGISSIRGAQNINEIGKMVITFPLPNFNEGDFDGYHIAYRPNLSVPPEIINIPEYTGSIGIEPFDFRTDTSVTFTNIDYATEAPYCFSIYPFVYLFPSGYTEYENGAWLCSTAEVTRANMVQFPGLSAAETTGNSILVSWGTPSVGIFDMFEVYLRRTDGTFSFSAARLQNNAGNFTNYVTAIVDRSNSTHRFTNLPNGKYRMGVLTYFAHVPPSGTPLVYRSEDNEGIYTCIVDGTDHECTAGN